MHHDPLASQDIDISDKVNNETVFKERKSELDISTNGIHNDQAMVIAEDIFARLDTYKQWFQEEEFIEDTVHMKVETLQKMLFTERADIIYDEQIAWSYQFSSYRSRREIGEF